MWYRYLDDFPCSILVSAIYCYGIAVLGIPQCPPPHDNHIYFWDFFSSFHWIRQLLTHICSHFHAYSLMINT